MPTPFPILYGPTASGKSTLAVHLALAIGRAEIVTADAFQVYRGMDIGTAKPAPDERRGVPHHLIDLADPHEATPFTVEDWLRRAHTLIDDLRSRGVTPIVVGGTSLYVQSLLHGLFEGPPADAALRARLAALPHAQLRDELARVDPAAAARIHPADTRRAIRAIEVFRATGTPISEHQRQWEARAPRPDARLVVLDWPTPELNRRINARVKDMLARGLLDELRRLRAAGPLAPQPREALGYKQLAEHLEGRSSLEDAVERTKIETRRFAKNQRTWIKRLGSLPGTLRLDAAIMPLPEQARAVLDTLQTKSV